jgi:hypothetical protein
MTSWAQSSQRATCPPRAAVRQLSIADITFNWPSMTWPALALRRAGPWSRKISATSRTRRPMTVEVYAGGLASPGWRVRRSSGLMTSQMVFVRLRLCRNPAGVSAGRDRRGFLRPLMRADSRPQSRPYALKERNPPISRKMIPITETSPHKPGRASTRSRQAASGRS